MKILYHMPFLNSINAGRTIYKGYENAFTDLGHKFKPLIHTDDPNKLFRKYKPDIFITSLNSFTLKYLDLDLIAKQKKLGLKVFVLIPAWKSPFSKMRLNETPSISTNRNYISLIKSHTFGDIYYNPM
jgi:hypothetical protein